MEIRGNKLAPYDCIFINGDSYSAPHQDRKVYGDFLGEFFNVPVKNYAVGGSNNDRILRTSIEFLNQLKTEYKNPLVIIGWSFITRLEVWDHRDDEELPILKKIPDRKYFPGSKFIGLDHLINTDSATLEQKALLANNPHSHKQLMNFFTNAYMFGHMLELLNFDYFLFSAANNEHFSPDKFPAINLYSQVQWVDNNKKMHRLGDFCVQQWANANDLECNPITGHLSENGHKKFATVLLDIIKEQYGNV